MKLPFIAYHFLLISDSHGSSTNFAILTVNLDQWEPRLFCLRLKCPLNVFIVWNVPYAFNFQFYVIIIYTLLLNYFYIPCLLHIFLWSMIGQFTKGMNMV